jgi:hypothetical protein
MGQRKGRNPKADARKKAEARSPRATLQLFNRERRKKQFLSCLPSISWLLLRELLFGPGTFESSDFGFLSAFDLRPSDFVKQVT